MQTTETMAQSTPRISYATPNDVFAGIEGGGSIAVEEFPSGDIAQAALKADRAYNAPTSTEEFAAPLVLSLCSDTVGGAPIDTVWFHPDQDNRLEVIARARAALDAAEAALLAVGYVDNAHLRSA